MGLKKLFPQMNYSAGDGGIVVLECIAMVRKCISGFSTQSNFPAINEQPIRRLDRIWRLIDTFETHRSLRAKSGSQCKMQ